MRCYLCAPKVTAKPAPVAAVPVPVTLTLRQPPAKPVPAPTVAPIQQEAPIKPLKAGDIIRHFLNQRYAQGEIIEVRARVPENDGEAIYSGVYTDHNAILRDVKDLTETKKATAIYTNLQTIKSEAECAVANTMGTGRNCTSASDIARYTRLLIDVDTARPEGFEKSSSTDEEKARAFDVITKAKNYMESLGLAGDLYDSGNGYHNVYALDLPATEENKLLIKAVLTSLGSQFDTGGAHIDTSVFDMPRVCKLIGSYARKGENTTERPHRWSGIISEAAELRPIPTDVLVKISGLKAAPAPRVQIQAPSAEIEKSLAWLRGFLDFAELDVQNEKPHEGGIILILRSDCPFEHKSGHHQGECHVGVNKEGKLAFACKHESCVGRGWKQFRSEIEEQLEERYAHGLIASDEPTAFAEAAQATPVATPKAEDMKATSLLIFKTAEHVARATELGFNALVAADFKPPLDPAYHRAVLFGSSQDDEFWAISSSVPGQGAHYVVLPRDKSKLGTAEYLNAVLSMRGVRDASVHKKQTSYVEVPADSPIVEVPDVSEAVKAVTVGPKAVELVQNLLFNNTDGRESMSLPGNADKAANMADRVVYEDLQKRGKFYSATNGLGYLVLSGLESNPIAISSEDDNFLNVLEKYGLHAGRKQTHPLGHFLGVRAGIDGEPVEISMSFRYNPDANPTPAAYYAEQPGVLLKVTKDGVTKIHNGEEGVLFTYPKDYKPWAFLGETSTIERSLVPARGSFLYDAMFKNLLFEDSVLTTEQKEILLTLYIALLFLPGLSTNKPILQTQGPTGSGKTFFLEMIGRLVLGPKFKPVTSPSDKAAFENLLVNNPYVAIDNPGRLDPDIRDTICAAATGLVIKKRELYTNTGEITLSAQATVAIASITSVLRETEHANRSIVTTFKKREGYKIGNEILRALDDQRDTIMSEIIHRIHMILIALDAQKEYTPTVPTRLSDVATYLLRVARHEGWEEIAEALLDAWINEQLSSAMADDDIGQLIVNILRQSHFAPRWMSAEKFRAALLGAAALAQTPTGSWSRKEAKALSTILQKNLAAYAFRYGLESVKDEHTGNQRYKLNPAPKLLERIRKYVQEDADTASVVTDADTNGDDLDIDV
jgi:hypothetical protein